MTCSQTNNSCKEATRACATKRKYESILGPHQMCARCWNTQLAGRASSTWFAST